MLADRVSVRAEYASKLATSFPASQLILTLTRTRVLAPLLPAYTHTHTPTHPHTRAINGTRVTVKLPRTLPRNREH